MGWDERKKRAKQFEQQTDDALDRDILGDDLFSKTPVKSRHYFEAVRETPDTQINGGAKVRLIDMKNRIDIYEGTRAVGRIESSQAEGLRKQLRLSERKGRSVQGYIEDVSRLTSTFTVRIGE